MYDAELVRDAARADFPTIEDVNDAVELRERLAVVLVGARNPLNIGAAARAMSNFGFADLRVVNEYRVPLEDARSAVNAAHVLGAAREFGSVAEAVADCSFVVGTTALGERRLEHAVDVLPDSVAKMRESVGRVALLFGSEKTGLSNEAFSHCHRLMTVPMVEQGVSMNLGQAVAVCLWEVVRGVGAPRALPEEGMTATAEQMGRFDALLWEVLEASGYTGRFAANTDEMKLRRLTRRLGLQSEDVDVWLGLLRQMLWKMRG